jgi:hypothetical protein
MGMHLSSLRCFLGDLESGLKAVSKEIAFYVKELCAIDETCDIRRRQVGTVEFFCGAKSGDERPERRSAGNSKLGEE